MDCRLTGKSEVVITLEQIKLKLLNLNWLIRCKSKDKKLLIYDYHETYGLTESNFELLSNVELVQGFYNPKL